MTSAAIISNSKRAPLKRLRVPLLVMALLALIFISMSYYHIQINPTGSLPIGLYQQQPTHQIHRGDIVAACLPKAIAKFSVERGYLSQGHCPGGALPVLKDVIAVPGDTVVLSQHAITVNGKAFLAPRATQDGSHRPILDVIPTGTYTNTQGFWLYGANAPQKSWDSRYYGPVSRDDIQGRYRPLFTW